MLEIIPEQMQQYWLYDVSDAKGYIVFVGVDRFNDIFTMRHLMQAPEFDMQAQYGITLHQAYEREFDARNARDMFINVKLGGKTPYFNSTVNMARRGKSILCEQNGQIYHTQSEAANALGISQSQLSKHLLRRKGYHAVKGLTFRYVHPQHVDKAHGAMKGSIPATIPATPETPPGYELLTAEEKSWYDMLVKMTFDTMTDDQRRYWLYLSGKVKAPVQENNARIAELLAIQNRTYGEEFELKLLQGEL